VVDALAVGPSLSQVNALFRKAGLPGQRAKKLGALLQQTSYNSTRDQLRARPVFLRAHRGAQHMSPRFASNGRWSGTDVAGIFFN